MLEGLTREGKRRLVRFGEPQDPLFYYFDYDQRGYRLNMEFQHFHAFYEMYILLGEEAEHIIEGQRYALKMYDIVCLRPGLLHKTQYLVGPPQRRLVINFSIPAAMEVMGPEFEQLLCIFDEQVPIYRFVGQVQQELFGALNRVFTDGGPKGLERLRTHVAFLEFLSLFFTNRGKNQYRDLSKNGALSEKIYDICACIHAHYRETLTLETLAQRFYISPHYLSHQFKEITQFNLTEYIQRTRIRNAQQALMFSDEQISKIAEECGFKSFSQFNRVFHKHCGTSPSQYRKENRPLYEKPQ